MGGGNPIRVQSMTTSDTQDIAATVRQAIALAEVGCEIVRVTAPNVAAARCLREIRAEFTRAGFSRVPLVADIHFLPQAAMEAVEHVEKVRINPGNYADKKRFAVREYTDADYQRELERLHESFTPLVLRAKDLGRCLRIGTNHGSLSDRIMNRYGDTPLGMVESALEFLRIAESHGFRQLVLSMKSSNPKVMIQAYRLLVERMEAEDMHYPLHLGVTEAGDGEDGRIKSAIGIGSLLLDGLGDTIRVSLTEDSVYEIPVAQAIAARAQSRWAGAARPELERTDRIDPHQFSRRVTTPVEWAPALRAGGSDVPRVLVRTTLAQWPALTAAVSGSLLADTPIEGALVRVESTEELARVRDLRSHPATRGPELLALECGTAIDAEALAEIAADGATGRLAFVDSFDATKTPALAALAARHGHVLAVATTPTELPALAQAIAGVAGLRLIVTLADDALPSAPGHAVGAYRALAEALARAHVSAPLWIRSVPAAAMLADPSFLGRLLEAAMLAGPPLHGRARRSPQHRDRNGPRARREADLQCPPRRGRAHLEDRVRRLPVLRTHALRPPIDDAAHPDADRTPQGREDRDHGLHRERPRRDGRCRFWIRRWRSGKDQPLRRQDLRAVQRAAGGGGRSADRTDPRARPLGRTRACFAVGRPSLRRLRSRNQTVT